MSDSLALGKQEVDLSVYAKVAAYETLRQEGVLRMNAGFTEKLGMNKSPGVSVRLLDDGGLQIDVSVIVRYGTDLRSLGPAVQEAVLSGLRRMSDQPVGQINVYIADIEFPRGEARPAEEGGRE
ncbi:MAG: Asp23/Gls24 family envelope stress response protein [Candidatus Hydrogenedentes bacterium]|nr:Asp23/Gls24 family envelope stress response protein [Candidatus Hydrogenedentota bacterium]